MNRGQILMAFGLPMMAIGIFGYASSMLKVALMPAPAAHSLAVAPLNIQFQPSVPDAGTASMPRNQIGVVHLAALLKVHPLAPVLTTDDRQLYTMWLLAASGAPVADHRGLLAAQTRLQNELRTTAMLTQKRLHARAQELTAEERRQISALVAAATANGHADDGANALLRQTDATLNQRAIAQQHTFAAGISAEQRGVLQSAEQGLEAQSRAALEAKAVALSQEESELGFKVAQQDEDERVRLRMRESNLQLSSIEKTGINTRLQNLDTEERETLADKRGQDSATLIKLAADLRDHRAAAASVAVDNAQTAGRGALAVAGQAAATAGASLPQASSTTAPIDTNLRARIFALRSQYQGRFNNEQAKSLQAFQQKRASLQAEFSSLEKADQIQHHDNSGDLERVSAQRGQIYTTMMNDIHQAIAHVAAERHLRVVLVDPLGVAPGVVDVTDEVAKSLSHEVR
jgi:hypothetical protein